jgi:predicted hotdog family 3-hydroxylacyl-ACP dehydratase
MKEYVAPIPRDAIARLIPHAGAMCLLDSVVNWDETSIRCVSARHRAKDNPLRQAGRVGALCGIEFAAQAMAVHGRLAGAIGARPRAGYLASLREVVCGCDRLDQFDGALIIEAMRLMGDEERVMYSFSITFEGRALVAGRATVILQAESPP